MSQQKEADYSHEYSIIMNTNYSKIERLAVVKSFTDRLKLTLDDISNSMNRERLNSLSIIPPDLLPFDVNLVDGNKVTILETDPVVTLYDGELTNIRGDILHVYLKNEGEDLDEDLVPPKRVCTVTAETLDKVLPSIISDLFIPGAKGSQVSIKAGTSEKPSQTVHENCEVKLDLDNSSSGENIETFLKNENTSGDETLKQIDNSQRSDDETSPFQVIGLLDMGSARDSGSEGLHNTVENFDSKKQLQIKESDSIILDKEHVNQSVSLRTPPSGEKKVINVRKSARAHKPKIRSHFQSWDDFKIRLPRYKQKRTSKGTKAENQNVQSKKLITKKKKALKGNKTLKKN